MDFCNLQPILSWVGTLDDTNFQLFLIGFQVKLIWQRLACQKYLTKNKNDVKSFHLDCENLNFFEYFEYFEQIIFQKKLTISPQKIIPLGPVYLDLVIVAEMYFWLRKGILVLMLQNSMQNRLHNSMHINDCRLTSLQNNQLTIPWTIFASSRSKIT